MSAEANVAANGPFEALAPATLPAAVGNRPSGDVAVSPKAKDVDPARLGVQPRLFGDGWIEVRDGDPSALTLYMRHYSCGADRKDGRRTSKLICGPGEKTVLLRADGRALFVWRRFIDDSGQEGVNCAAFRNEGQEHATAMILEAEALARQRWPRERFYTYVDPREVRPTFTRGGRPTEAAAHPGQGVGGGAVSVRILIGDCRARLRELETASVQTVVTSPPYFGLRDYGTGQWEGGAEGCVHRVGGQVQDSKAKGAITAGVRPGVDASRCLDCGARRVDQQIGLEGSPDAYVAELVEVFREVRRVLRDDGTVWLNLGDSYASTSTYNAEKGGGAIAAGAVPRGPNAGLPPGLKAKDLIGIPWMVAFALRADGWHLRQDIIWAKPNPMPESVQDRCTKAHEYLFLLSKGPRYHFDAEAIAERAVAGPPGNHSHRAAEAYAAGDEKHRTTGGLAAYARRERSRKNSFARGTKDSGGVTGEKPQFREDREPIAYEGRRNRRSVWTVASEPFKEAHFATYPPALIEPCILAGCPAGGTVLDPFGGAGTTGLVADRLQRHAVLVELNPEYAELARRRIAEAAGSLFGDVVEVENPERAVA